MPPKCLYRKGHIKVCTSFTVCQRLSAASFLWDVTVESRWRNFLIDFILDLTQSLLSSFCSGDSTEVYKSRWCVVGRPELNYPSFPLGSPTISSQIRINDSTSSDRSEVSFAKLACAQAEEGQCNITVIVVMDAEDVLAVVLGYVFLCYRVTVTYVTEPRALCHKAVMISE